MMADDCSNSLDPLKLVREGTSQDQRQLAALDPAQAPVDDRSVRHGIVFAQAYAQFLNYVDASNKEIGNWATLFGADPAVPLATAASEDVHAYTTTIRSWFDFLNNPQNQSEPQKLSEHLGYLYAAVGTVATGLDDLKERLPSNIPLKDVLRNLIRTQLAPALTRLIAYYRAGEMPTSPSSKARGLIDAVAPDPTIFILRQPVPEFTKVLAPDALSNDWAAAGVSWDIHVNGNKNRKGIVADDSVYGDPAATVFAQINHCSTHNLFRSIFDQFLQVLVRVVSEADQALGNAITTWDRHEPHYALFLAFLQLNEHVRTSANTLTQRHLDFYYREILKLKEKPAQPGSAHLIAELARQVTSRHFAPGELFKAGKDSQGKEAFFANFREATLNQAKVAAQSTLYRHGGEPVVHDGRIFASSIANSDDGLGAPMTSTDTSWHPFFNKEYKGSALSEIHMPTAEIGFAVASHYFLMAEGKRRIYLEFGVGGSITGVDFTDDVHCFLTTEKGWLEVSAKYFKALGATQTNTLALLIELSGAEAPIVPYSAKTHDGYAFQTGLPMLRVTLTQDMTRPYAYGKLEKITVKNINILVYADQLKTLAVSNDFGPIDSSKPFQPFGASPVAGSSLVIGSKEVFQKQVRSAWINVEWLIEPEMFSEPGNTPLALPSVNTEFLNAGQWVISEISPSETVKKKEFQLTVSGKVALDQLMFSNIIYKTTLSRSEISRIGSDKTTYNEYLKTLQGSQSLDVAIRDEPDFTSDEPYGTQSRHGFVRLRLTGSFGQQQYQDALVRYLNDIRRAGIATRSTVQSMPVLPPAPTAAALTMGYCAITTLNLETTTAPNTPNGSHPAQFFHLLPFGTAEQKPGNNVLLLPQFTVRQDDKTLVASEAEYYIGIAGLQPPQTLSLLFQVIDGTANPLADTSSSHLAWSYLAADQWQPLGTTAVVDSTQQWLDSGIVTLTIPREATNDHTLMPSGLHWIRVAMHEKSDAVCRFQLVAAQGVKAVFADRGNAPDFSATPLPAGTIRKLDTPDAAVKSITQPFPSFGGRGAEQPQDFYTRVSERLRHKNRAIDLWDYERLILEAFPQVYKVKCLNHTCFEPETGVYRELAPGHVTVVAIPDLKFQQQRDPLKPYTSLGVLRDIENFLKARTSGFARLHVKNPKFEAIRVSFRLRLHEGYDEGYYKGLLQQAITRFLSPWAFAEDGAPSFGGTVYKSVLIDFVEGQPYVDYVTDFQLFQDIDDKPGSVDLDEVTASRAVSVLVSAPADAHQITPIPPAQEPALAERCGCGGSA